VLAQLRSRVGICLAPQPWFCAFNVWVFVAWPQAVGRFTPRTSGIREREIRDHDRQLGSVIQFIRSHYDTRDVVLCHSDEYLVFGPAAFSALPAGVRAIPIFRRRDGLASTGQNQCGWCENGRLTFVDKLDVTGKEGNCAGGAPGGRRSTSLPRTCHSRARRFLPQTEDDLYYVPAEGSEVCCADTLERGNPTTK